MKFIFKNILKYFKTNKSIMEEIIEKQSRIIEKQDLLIEEQNLIIDEMKSFCILDSLWKLN